MKRPRITSFITETGMWLKLMEFTSELSNRTKDVRRLWRRLPAVRQHMSPRAEGRQLISVRNYTVPYGEGLVEERAARAGIRLSFSVQRTPGSYPPESIDGERHLRDILFLMRRSASQIHRELILQGLLPARLSDLIDLLAAMPHNVQAGDPLYAVSEERPNVYRILRVRRVDAILTIDMPQDLPHRRCDQMPLLPAGSRILGAYPPSHKPA